MLESEWSKVIVVIGVRKRYNGDGVVLEKVPLPLTLAHKHVS
jgi:hypothetical protein